MTPAAPVIATQEIVTMKRTAFTLIALVLSSAVASAACPIGTRYQCVPMANGKLNCGCY